MKNKPDELIRHIRKVIRNEREFLEMTQAELASEAGMSQKGYGRIERGDRKSFYFSSFIRISDALGLYPSEILQAARKQLEKEIEDDSE